MKALNITLVFNGKTEAAFDFYKSVFGGEYSNVQRMKDMPGASPMSAEEGEKIMHMSLPITGNQVLMGMDMPEGRGTTNMGDNFFITLDTSSEEETTKLFNGLSKGGSVMMPLAKQFWGSFFGMVTDPFGVQWMLSYAYQNEA